MESKSKRIMLFYRILLVFISVPWLITNNTFAQEASTITGLVTEVGSNNPLIGVNVYIEGTTTGTLTDVYGNYTLNVPSVESVLVFSYIGYEAEKITVGDKTVINVQMTPEDIALDEVVVIGYGSQKKKLVTGATAQVSGESIERVNTSSALRALQSQSPGLSIVSTSGRPDADFKINIRGLGTIGNAKPLVVIDGIAGGDLRNISPADIESVDILKDAASSAIYGARAANGVILITTKQGKPGKNTISYDGYYGVQNPERYIEMTGIQDYIMLVNESEENSGRTATDFQTKVPASLWQDVENGWNGTDWLRELTNVNAPVSSHALNFTGATESSSYSVGTSYLYQEAVLGNPIKEQFERYTIRVNSNHKFLEKNNRSIVRFGENFLYTYKKNKNQTNAAWRWLSATPLLPVRDTTGEFARDDYVRFFSPLNPVAYQYYNSLNEQKLHDMRLNAYMEIEPLKNLVYRSNFGYSVSSFSYRRFVPVYDFGSGMGSLNRVDETSQLLNIGISYQWENTINYQFSLGEKHNFNTLVGQSIERTGLGESIRGSNTGSLFNTFDYAYLVNAPTITSSTTELTGGPLGEWALASFFGRLMYDFDETYLLTAIVRRDGSSNFSPERRWGVFPSVSAGWVISNEGFFSALKDKISLLKLRASWGQNGNQDILPFQFVSPFSFSSQDYYFGTDKTIPTIGGYPSLLGNELVTWETSEQINLGLDINFFQGRVQYAFDVYKKDTKDWLVAPPTLAIHGAEAGYINGGAVENKGFEMSLTYKDRIGKLSYSFAGSLGFNKNEITLIKNTEGYIEGARVNELANSQPSPYRAQVGYPISYFYGYKTAGVFQTQEEIDAYTGPKINGDNTEPGDLIFVDTDKDGEITSDDRTMIGDPNPDATFGFTANFNYGGFDLSITAAGVAGNDILTAYHSGSVYSDNYPEYYLDRWHGEGTSNRYPRITSRANANYLKFSDIYLNKGNYLRIQNLSLGYDFKKLLPNIPQIDKMRLFFAVQNLYTFTKYIGPNPEVGADKGVGPDPANAWAKGIDVYFNPIPRTFSLGVNLAF